jgi:hypothetical protein
MLLQRKFRSSAPALSGRPLLLRLVLIGLVVAGVFGAMIGVGAVPADAATAGVTTTELTVPATGGGAPLRAAVVAPAATVGPHPGLVLVHGSGPHVWEEYRPQAEAFARAGIVTLIYDKRIDGYSLMERDFDVLADDALAAVQVLRRHHAVDGSRVGLLGFSEGGWVAPLAAATSDDIAFLVEVGASGLPPAQAQAWSYGNWLRHAGVTGSLLHTAQVTGPRTMSAAGMFPEADFDPLPLFERMRQPVLAIWGAHDQQVPPRESALALQQALERGGNRRYTIRFIADARHTMERSPDGFARREGFAPGYIDTVTSWVNGLTDDTRAVNVQPAPRQAQHSAVLPSATSMTSWLLVAAVPMLLAVFATYPLTAAVRRLAGRRGAPPNAWGCTLPRRARPAQRAGNGHLLRVSRSDGRATDRPSGRRTAHRMVGVAPARRGSGHRRGCDAGRLAARAPSTRRRHPRPLRRPARGRRVARAVGSALGITGPMTTKVAGPDGPRARATTPASTAWATRSSSPALTSASTRGGTGPGRSQEPFPRTRCSSIACSVIVSRSRATSANASSFI